MRIFLRSSPSVHFGRRIRQRRRLRQVVLVGGAQVRRHAVVEPADLRRMAAKRPTTRGLFKQSGASRPRLDLAHRGHFPGHGHDDAVRGKGGEIGRRRVHVRAGADAQRLYHVARR